MAKIFENSKQYKILILSAEEMKKWPRAAVCDRCGCRQAPTGFYVAAYNLFYCDECYAEWNTGSQKKQSGVEAQERNYLNHAIVRLNFSSFFFGKISG